VRFKSPPAKLVKERGKVVKDPDFYQAKNQHELDIFLRKCMQVFEVRPVTYRMDFDRVQYAQMWLTGDIFDVWNRKYEPLVEETTWELFKETLQEHPAPQRLRMLDVGQKLKELRQRPKQSVSQLYTRLDSLEDQLPTRLPEHQCAN
jgi:hypothetical protein